jgi:hypothetical protein
MGRIRFVLVAGALAGCVDDPVFVGDTETTSGSGGSASSSSVGSTSASGPGSASSTTPATTVSVSSASTGGQGGAGGGSVSCPMPLVPPAPPCGGIQDTFDDITSLSSWYESGESVPTDIDVGMGELMIHKPGAETSTLVETLVDVSLVDCALWARIEPDTQPLMQSRLSFANAGSNAMFAVGYQDGEIRAWLSGLGSVGMSPYDPQTTRYVRVREEAGQIHFGHSADGVCWTEFHSEDAPNDTTARARLVVQGFSNSNDATAYFDDFGVTP